MPNDHSALARSLHAAFKIIHRHVAKFPGEEPGEIHARGLSRGGGGNIMRGRQICRVEEASTGSGDAHCLAAHRFARGPDGTTLSAFVNEAQPFGQPAPLNQTSCGLLQIEAKSSLFIAATPSIKIVAF
jgi:hypothetical protein